MATEKKPAVTSEADAEAPVEAPAAIYQRDMNDSTLSNSEAVERNLAASAGE